MIKGVRTPFFEGEFTLPYKSSVYRDNSEQVPHSANAVKIPYFDIKVNFFTVHLMTLTLTSCQATVLILVISCISLVSCNNVMHQNRKNGSLCIAFLIVLCGHCHLVHLWSE